MDYGCGLNGELPPTCGLEGEISSMGDLHGEVCVYTQCPELEQRIEEAEKCCETNAENIGDLDSLATTDKTSLVAAVNEINSKTDAYYVHDQLSAQTVWNINHNLGKIPCITVIDTNGLVVQGDYEIIDDNNVKLTFTIPLMGKAILN